MKKRTFNLTPPAETGDPVTAGNFQRSLEYGMDRMNVGTSLEEVERIVREKVDLFKKKHPHLRWSEGCVEEMIEYARYLHQVNFVEYCWVMGTHGYTGKKKKGA